MGLCLSCFRRKKPSLEREPLLPKIVPKLPPSRLDKVADIVAALQSGKLPSQDQLNRLLQSITSSRILQCETSLTSGKGPLSINGRRVLNDAKEVVEAILQTSMEKNMDDRLQDLLYQCSQIDGPPIHVDTNTTIEAGQEGLSKLHDQAPASQELSEDSMRLLKSMKTVFPLLLTSATFRLLLSDILVSARKFLAHMAANVGNVALEIQAAAGDIERAAKMEDGTVNILAERVEEAAGGILGGIEQASKQPTTQETTRDTVIARVQELIVRAHQDPQTISALRTLLLIIRKYSKKFVHYVHIISDVQTSATADVGGPAISAIPKQEVSQALMDLKILLERLASGHSLDPLLHSFSKVIRCVTEELTTSASTQDLELRQYFHSVDRWLDRALSSAQPAHLYATSRAGTRALENLYDGSRILFLSSSSYSWTKHLNVFLTEYDMYTDALVQDRSTMRLIGALSNLHVSMADFATLSLGFGTRVGDRSRRWKEEAIQDLFGWFIPRILGIFGRIGVPMARMEFQNDKVDGALDALPLGVDGGGVELELVPDSVIVRTWNEIRVDIQAPVITLPPTKHDAVDTRTSSRSMLQVHIDGIRLSVRDLGYFFRYKGGLVGYADQGLLSVEVGNHPSPSASASYPISPQGVNLDIELSLDGAQQENRQSQERLFTIQNIRASIPGLHFRIDRSKHWILNSLFVQPLAGPAVAWIVGRVLENKVTDMLEGIERVLAGVKKEAWERSRKRGAEEGVVSMGEEVPALSDYWEALVEKGSSVFGLENDLCSGEAGPHERGGNGVETQTSTKATLKGIVHTTTTVVHPDAPASFSREQEMETSVAIGGGAQLFPDKAGAYDGMEGGTTPVLDQVAHVVEDTAAEVGDIVESGIENAMDSAVRLREGVERAEERREERTKLESKKGGWRSQAFDLEDFTHFEGSSSQIGLVVRA